MVGDGGEGMEEEMEEHRAFVLPWKRQLYWCTATHCASK